jgi:hypothetical protein
LSTIRKRVNEAAMSIISASPGGIRWADLHRAVAKQLDEKANRREVGHTFSVEYP